MSSSASSWITSTTSSTVIHPDEAPGLADHRGRDEVVLVEDVAHLLLIGLGRDRPHIPRHDIAQPNRPAGAEQSVQRDPPDRPVLRVDDVDLVEVVRHVGAGLAHVVDGLAHGPEGRQRHALALHQAAGAVLGIGQAFRDANPLLARDRIEDLLALRVVEVFEHGDGRRRSPCPRSPRRPAPRRSRQSAPRGSRPRHGRARRRSAHRGRRR